MFINVLLLPFGNPGGIWFVGDVGRVLAEVQLLHVDIKSFGLVLQIELNYLSDLLQFCKTVPRLLSSLLQFILDKLFDNNVVLV